MKIFTRIATIIMLILAGFLLGVVLLKTNQFLIIMSGVWDKLAFWIALSIGAVLPIIINYYSIKKQEIIKIKAQLIRDQIDIIRSYRAFDLTLRSTISLDTTLSDLSFGYEPTPQDLSEPSLRGLYILSSHEIYNEWKINLTLHIEKLNGFGSKKILNYTWFILHYLLNMEIITRSIPNENLWQVSIALQNDFFMMSNEFGAIIDNYYQKYLFRFKTEINIRNESIDKSNMHLIEKFDNTNLTKYRDELKRNLYVPS